MSENENETNAPKPETPAAYRPPAPPEPPAAYRPPGPPEPQAQQEPQLPQEIPPPPREAVAGPAPASAPPAHAPEFAYPAGSAPVGYGGAAIPPPPGDTQTWAVPAPGEPRRAGRGALAAVGIVVLMAIAAGGGGIAGAAIYAQTQDEGSGGNVTQVVDAPQLEYTSLASIASQVSPSVVSIRAGDFGGSGVVMSADGYVITNAHVVEAAGNSQVRVRFSDGEIADATIVGADPRSDIAVIKVDGVDGLTPASFGDSTQALVGDAVLAIGSPLGYDGSVTQGIVSAMDRTLSSEDPNTPSLSGLIQIDAAINRGNSGGALVNLAGEVIGINTAIAIENQDDSFLGVGFAIPSNRAAEVANTLIEGDEVDHPYLGVWVAPGEEGGAVIGQVAPDSPAAEAGLQEGDVVLRIGDQPVTNSSDLVNAVQAADVGQALEVEFQRDGTTQTTTVTLAEAAD